MQHGNAAAFVADLLSRMTLEEKIGQLCQYVGPGIDALTAGELATQDPSLDTGDNLPQYRDLTLRDILRMVEAGEIGSFLSCYDPGETEVLQRRASKSRLAIPLLFGVDAIHGHGMYKGGATVFPTPLSLAAGFSAELVYRVARATARETHAAGAHWTFWPNVDVTRDPRWGRMGETFGESVALVSELGAATVRGLQGDGIDGVEIAACAKHFAAGGTPENGVNFAPMDVSERTLREVYLEPFRVAVNAGVRTFMAAHNEVNGVPCHGNSWLLRSVLRDEWEFEGFVVSDWTDISRLHTLHRVAETESAAQELALDAGVEMHMHGPGFFDSIVAAVHEGRVEEARVDEAAARILRLKYELGLFETTSPSSHPDQDRTAAAEDGDSNNIALRFPEHDELALESARRCPVLLTNDGVLPIAAGSVVVTGPNADNQTLLGDWAAHQPDENVTTIVDGLETVGTDVSVRHVPCEQAYHISDDTIACAVDAARKASVAVVAVGDNSLRGAGEDRTCGENLDRSELELHGRQNDLLRAIAETGTPLVVVIVSGRALICDWVYANANAVLYAFEPGARGGQAIAEILLGRTNPSGRLPVTIPRSVGHIPQYHDHPDASYFRTYKDADPTPWFPFGHGLSYTTFEYADLEASVEDLDSATVGVTVTNTGSRDGEHVMCAYIRDCFASVTRPVRRLAGFSRITLPAGASKRVDLPISRTRFELVDTSLRRVVEPGEFELTVGELRTVVRVSTKSGAMPRTGSDPEWTASPRRAR